MSSHSDTTTDHKVIQKWIESRGGKPAKVGHTEDKRGPGILRVDFGGDDEKLEVIEWEEFFAAFDEHHLAFLHQDKTADGKPSRFNKFVTRHDEKK